MTLVATATYHRSDARPRDTTPHPGTDPATSPRCSSRAATRSGAGAPTSGSAASTGRTRRRTRQPEGPRRRAAVETAAEDARPGWSRIATARPSAGSASDRATTSTGCGIPRSSRPSTTSRSGRSCASSSARRARGQGVATRPARAGDRLRAGPRRDDARGVPGRDPSRRAASRRRTSTRAPLSMFERAGFEVVERRQWNATTPVRPIVRRATVDAS